MQISGRMAVFVVCLMSMTLSACQPQHQTRVKLTASVTAGGKVYTGSAVQRYSCRESLHIMNDLGGCEIEGEAVVVNVAGAGPLFLIINGSGGWSRTDMVLNVLGAVSENAYTVTQRQLPQTWVLTTDRMPMMVRFDKLDDPGSVHRVDPSNLKGTFADDVTDISVQVTRTDEAPAFGRVEKLIPWIDSRDNALYDSFYKGDRKVDPVAQQLSQYDFVSHF